MGAVITWFDASFAFNVLRFDVVESESMTSTIETSDHPVEAGADITDHAKRALKTASIGAFVSQKPTRGGSLTRDGFVDAVYQPLTLTVPVPNPSFLQGGVIASLGRLISGPPSPVFTVSSTLQFFQEKNRFEEVLIVLEKLQSTFQLVECATTPWSVTNAMITNVTPTRDATTGMGGRVQIDFKEIRKVRLKTANTPVSAQPKAKPKVDLGKKPPPPVDKLPGGGSSLLTAIGNALGRK